MRRCLPILAVLLLWAGSAHAHGLLIPDEKPLPPLAMLNHKVSITIEDQVATTRVDQTFRNHTDRPLEATYVFPVPKGASVDKFTMYVDGKEVKGELLDAKKAREVYTSIVRRTQDPGLLEYMDNNLFRMRVFPIPAKGDQKVSLSFKAVLPREGDVVEYVYPLKTDGKATSTLEAFSIEATIKSQHNVQNVYSPTHAITLKRQSDKELTVNFDRNQGLLDKDFQLFYQLGDKDVGLTTMVHRPISGEHGYFMFLITPKVEMPKDYAVPRDMVLVLDTSGSMKLPESSPKINQAKKALKVVLENLTEKDRFAMIHFGTAVNTYKDGLLPVNSEQLTQAYKWVDDLSPSGGTNISTALEEALKLRPKKDEGRNFTVIFLTDGQPTLGETNPDKILKNTLARNTGNTRIFTFGVGDDVNATMLDQLAEQTRAVATYVRPSEDISQKTSGLVAKISHPVLANLKLTATNGISLAEVYPQQLPDLFHGQQLVVMGRYTGKGNSAIRLTGTVGQEEKEFAYDFTFPEKTGDERAFVEQIWARRKVGYLLDQIRIHGENKELVDEVTTLAKRYGITTPYTSYLIVPDMPVPVVTGPPIGGPIPLPRPGGPLPPALVPAAPGAKPVTVEDFAKKVQEKPGDLATNRGKYEGDRLEKLADDKAGQGGGAAKEAKDKKDAYDQARELFRKRQQSEVQNGKLGVDLSVQMNNLRNQTRLEQTAQRNVAGRNVLEIGGVWIDEGFDAKMPTVKVKAQSDAYFRILDRQAKVKEVFQLGNHLVWVTPNGTALVIDSKDGQEKLSDEEIDKLFVKK